MKETELQNTNSLANDGHLTVKYAVIWILLAILSTLVVCITSYSIIRSQGIQTTVEKMLEVIPHATNFIELEPGESESKPHVSAFRHFSQTPNISETSLFAIDGSLFASSDLDQKLDEKEISQARKLFSGRSRYFINDASFYEPRFWREILISNNYVQPVMLSVRYEDGTVNSVARLEVNFDSSVERAQRFVFIIFGVTLLMSLISFGLLYRRFRLSVIKIRQQSQELNKQVGSLSEALDANDELRQSMKNASRRAVELNEQFLRRTGADLHDGPAQLIGYAMLRLNKMSEKKEAKELGHEFHGIREALETSLEEIRGISSGLVLPELEAMTLEECINKVVAVHGTKSDCVIKEYYKDIPEDLPLPIKICTYRFIQEGLNNAERHGKADKCRITANVTNGVLHVSLKDNRVGFRKSLLDKRNTRLGLLGLKDRVESLGGTFSINSKLAVGTALKLSINLQDVE